MSIEQVPQKKLKLFHILSLAFYYILTFILPIAYSISVISITKTEVIKNHYRFPLLALIIVVVVLLVGINVLNKNIEKIHILNLDGSYNKQAKVWRIIITVLCKALPAIVIISAVAWGGSQIKELIDNVVVSADDLIDQAAKYAKDLVNFYVKFVAHNLGFYIAGIVVNKSLVFSIEYEIDLRNKVSEQQAVARRSGNIQNLAK